MLAGKPGLAAVHNGRMWIMVEVDRGMRIRRIGEQSIPRTGSGVGEQGIDRVDGHWAGSVNDHVDGRDVRRRHADRLGLHATGELWQQAFDAAGQPRRHRDDRLHRRAGAAQVGVVVAISQRLVVHDRVQRGQQHVVDANLAREQFEHRHDGVGRARGVGYQLLLASQCFVVDAIDDCRVDIGGAVGRVRQQQARAAGGDEAVESAAGAVVAGTFDDQIDPQFFPVDGFRRRRMADGDGLAVDDQLLPLQFDRRWKSPVR